MAPRFSMPLFSPMVRSPSFAPRPPVGTTLSTVNTMPHQPRPLVTRLRLVPSVLKYSPGVPVPDLVAKGVGPLAVPEKPHTTIYVGKIASTVEDEFLRPLLELCGSIKSWKRAQDPTTDVPKGFGFCEFESAEGVLRALRLLNKFSLEGQELVLNVNQATRDYLERYVAKKLEKEKLEEAEKEEETAPGVEVVEPKKPYVEISKSDTSESEKGAEDNGKKFGIVNNADREADEEARNKLSNMLEERARLKPHPLLPPLPVASDAPSKSNSLSEAAVKLKDGDSLAGAAKDGPEGKNEDEITSENKWERDRERGIKRETERELERYERDRERERVRREREREMRIRDVERLYEEREKQWEERERERERQRQTEREREKERERERLREINDQEDESDDEIWRKRWHRGNFYEERRRRRQREREEDEADHLIEEQEIAEAKRQRFKEVNAKENKRKHDTAQQAEVDEPVPMAVDGHGGFVIENQATKSPLIPSSDHNKASVLQSMPAETVLGNGTCIMVGDEGEGAVAIANETDGKQTSSSAPRKLGFGLIGSGKRAAVPSVFHDDDEEEAPKDRKLRPLVPIDYSAEEMQVAVTSMALPSVTIGPNLAGAAEFAKTLTSLAANYKEERKEEFERDRRRKLLDRSSDKGFKEREENWNREKERDRGREDRPRERNRTKYRSSDKELEKERSMERPRESESRKLLDAKQLIDTIPKAKEELFGYYIDWTIYDKHDLQERMRPWISKKIKEFLGEEETTLVDFIVNNTRKHVTAAHMLELLESILDDEAEMFVLKMWRMLIFEIRKVETGLASKAKS